MTLLRWVVLCLSLAAFVHAQPASGEFEVISPANAARLERVGTVGYGWMHDARWSPDSRYLFVAASNGLVIYEAGNWHQPTVIPAKNPALVDIDLSPDGSRIALVERESIRVLDVATREELYSVEADVYGKTYGDMQYLQLTESYLLAFVHLDRRYVLRIWDIASGDFIADIALDIEYTPFDWYADDALVEQLLAEQNMRLLTAVPDVIINGERWSWRQMVISENGEHILRRVCRERSPSTNNCETNRIVIQRGNTGEIISTVDSTEEYVNFASGDKNLLVVTTCILVITRNNQGCIQWQMQLVDAANNTIVATLPGYFVNFPEVVSYSPDERYLFVGDHSRVIIWDKETLTIAAELGGYHSSIQDIEFHVSGDFFAASSKSFRGGISVNFWSSSNGAFGLAGSIPCGGAIALHPAEPLLLCGGANNHVSVILAPMELWRIPAAEIPTLQTRFADQLVTDVAFSPDGQLMAIATGDRVDIREIASNGVLATFRPNSIIPRMQFSADGAYLLLNDGLYRVDLVQVIRASSPEEYELPQRENRSSVSTSVFSDDGRYTALATTDGRVVIAADDVPLHEIPLSVNLLRFSPDNTLLVAATQTYQRDNIMGRLHLIATHSGEILFSSDLNVEGMHTLVFNPQGTLLAIGTGLNRAYYDPGIATDHRAILWAVPAAP